MALQAVTVQMPDTIYRRAKQAADALRRPLEDVLVDTLAATLPALDDVPTEMVSELAAMAHLSDEALHGLANTVMLPERQQQLHDLLERQGRGDLDESGRRELAALMGEYGRHMLRRAKAVALLMARGQPIPALTTVPLRE